MCIGHKALPDLDMAPQTIFSQSLRLRDANSLPPLNLVILLQEFTVLIGVAEDKLADVVAFWIVEYPIELLALVVPFADENDIFESLFFVEENLLLIRCFFSF